MEMNMNWYEGSLELAFRRGMAYQKDLTNDQQESE